MRVRSAGPKPDEVTGVLKADSVSESGRGMAEEPRVARSMRVRVFAPTPVTVRSDHPASVLKRSSLSKRPEVRVVEGGKIEIRFAGDSRWDQVSRSRLARDYAADHPLWEILTQHGIQRPAPSGWSRPNAERDRRLYTLRLRPEDAERLDGLARKRGLCRSDLVMALVTRAEGKRTAAKE